MIKFRIHRKIWEGSGANLGKCWKNVKIIGFFEIFWDILNKMKDNFGQECVKLGLISFQGKIETIVPDFLGKNGSFYSFDSTFLPVPF